MKRSEVLKLIEGLYNLEMQNFPKENPPDIFAENLLCHLEELGFARVETYGDDEKYTEVVPYEPEEGWDAYFAEQEKKDQARDFQVITRINHITGEYTTTLGMKMAQTFLEGKSFEEIAQEYNVTRERVRQMVAKQRRRYQKYMEGKSDE